jgi:putative sterol carrier protein
LATMASDELLERIRAIAQTNYPLIKDKLSSVEQVFVLQLSDGGSYIIRVNNASISVDSGTHPAPTATLITSSGDLRAILDGQMDATKAFLEGKVQVRGDIFRTLALNSLLKGAR